MLFAAARNQVSLARSKVNITRKNTNSHVITRDDTLTARTHGTSLGKPSEL